jgi:hypothetical protein
MPIVKVAQADVPVTYGIELVVVTIKGICPSQRIGIVAGLTSALLTGTPSGWF